MWISNPVPRSAERHDLVRITLVRISPSRTADKARLAGAAGMAVARRASEQLHEALTTRCRL
jgi:hypothetical protein